MGPGPPPPGSPGWTWEGRVAPQLGAGALGPAYRLAGNTTLVSPEFDVAEGSQTILVRVRGRVPVVVSARMPGDLDRELALLAPGGPAGRHVPLPGLEGQRVRLVFDPLPALGQSVEIGTVGRTTARIPGWRLLEGVPEVRRVGARRALQAASGAVELESQPFAVPRRGLALRVQVWGRGVLKIQAGRFRRTVAAKRRWRDVMLPVDATRRSALTLRLRATPGAGPLLVRDLGVVMSPIEFSSVRVVRRPNLTLVRGRVGPGGAGVRVRLISGGAEIAADRADRRGRWIIRTRRSGAARLVVDDPERFHPGRTIRL